MKNSFTADFFKNNRKRLQSAVQGALIIVAANGQIQRTGDTTFPFRQDSSFWYLTGISEPDFALVIDEGESFLVLPEREPTRDLWEGAPDITKLLKTSGIGKVMERSELKKRIARAKRIARPEPLPAHIAAHGFYTNPGRANLEKLLKDSEAEKIDIRKDIARLRQVKQSVELAAIQQAINITARGFAELRKHLSSCKTESDADRILTISFLENGAEGHAYQPIVASGAHATTLHYISNDAVLADNSLLLIDAGAEYQGYAADITRTWAVGKVSDRERQIHSIVAKVQVFAYKRLKPGVLIKEYEKTIHEYLAEQLVKGKVFVDKVEAAKACPHAISHFLGLDVHDAADYDLPLAENMVLTVEPGVYLQDKGIGVRIEDNIVITKTGCRVMSQGLPSGL